MKRKKDERYEAGYPTWLGVMPEEDLRILWAHLVAGVQDNHSAQDGLGEEAWKRAEYILEMAHRLERIERQKSR